MIQYPKTLNLYKRDTKGVLQIGKYSDPLFNRLPVWNVTEKIDGTNIRLYADHKNHKIAVRGRTDNSQLHYDLYKVLSELFTYDQFVEVFGDDTDAILFGEGYGAKIQKGGGRYIPDGQGFALFDVFINGIWLENHNVHDIADKLSLATPPYLGLLTVDQVFSLVAEYPKSLIAHDEEYEMEGVVAVADPMVLHRTTMCPVKFKLKCQDVRRATNLNHK